MPVLAALIVGALAYFFGWLQSKPRVERLERAVVRQSQRFFALRCAVNGGTVSGADCIIPGVPAPERWENPLED